MSQPTNTIETLREHLFFTLEGLRDKENPMDIERAKAVCDVAQTIINSAKVEVDAIRATGSAGSGFMTPGAPRITSMPTASGTKTVEQRPGFSITTHKAS